MRPKSTHSTTGLYFVSPSVKIGPIESSHFLVQNDYPSKMSGAKLEILLTMGIKTLLRSWKQSSGENKGVHRKRRNR